jgi:hypothetical protein
MAVELILLGGNVMFALLAFTARSALARINECLRHHELDIGHNREELNQWELEYAKAHGPLVARVDQIEAHISPQLSQLSADLRSAAMQIALQGQQLSEMSRRLTNVESMMKETGAARIGMN